MSIDFQKPTSLYSQIVEHIKKQISLSHYKKNNQLNSQQKLDCSYKVSLIAEKPVKFSTILKPRLVIRNSTPHRSMNKSVKLSDQMIVVK